MAPAGTSVSGFSSRTSSPNVCWIPRLVARAKPRLAPSCTSLIPGHRSRMCALDQVGRDGKLKQPDRLEVRREERTCRTERVVDVRVLQVSVAVSVEDVRGEVGGIRHHASASKDRSMNRALSKPELIPVDPEAVMKLSAIRLATARTAVLTWRERIEVEQRPVARASDALARQQCFRLRNEQRPVHDLA